MKAKTEEKKEAIRLRLEERLSYNEISSKLGIAKSTLSGWLKSLPLTEREKKIKAARLLEGKKDETRRQLKRYNFLDVVPQTTKVDENYNPKQVGDVSEAQILALFIKHGFRTLVPFGDKDRYDLVVDENSKFIRVQCKTARYREDGSFEFSTCSSNWVTYKKTVYYGQADVFAVYLRETEDIYIFNVDNAPARSCTAWLIDPPQHNSRDAKNHLFDPEKSLLLYP